MITQGFTCTGAYALLILLGIKRVENRSVMPPVQRGRCAISCSKSFCREEYGSFIQWASRVLSVEDFERMPAWDDIKDWPGKVVGACDYCAYTKEAYELSLHSDSLDSSPRLSWDEGYPYWWKLSEIVCFETPIPCRGNVGMWTLTEELAKRVTDADTLAHSVGTRISTPDDARRIFNAALPLVGESEGFFVLPLDADCRVLAPPILVSLGTSSATTVVQPKDVFIEALKVQAEAIIVAHNHPHGNPAPSPQDRALTKELAHLSEGLGIRLIDHLILV